MALPILANPATFSAISAGGKLLVEVLEHAMNTAPQAAVYAYNGDRAREMQDRQFEQNMRFNQSRHIDEMAHRWADLELRAENLDLARADQAHRHNQEKYNQEMRRRALDLQSDANDVSRQRLYLD